MRIRAVDSSLTSALADDRQHRADTYRAWGVCGLLVVAIGLIYGQTLDHALLVFDDSLYVSQNPHVMAGLSGEGIRWAFTDGPAGEWYPLAMLSHMLDCQLFGLNAWGHHLTNLLLHAAASIALFLVLRRMTGELWPSAFVATIFAVHPQHVESVAWLAERRDVLSGLFFALTLGAWLGYVRHGRTLRRYLPVAALFALGLMAKPMAVTLPALLILLDFWPLARFGSVFDAPGWTRSVERPGWRRLVLEKLPLVALAAGACLMTWRTHADANAPVIWSARIAGAAVACATYVVQLLYPVNLVAFYPTPVGGPPAWKVAGAIAILAAASAAAVIWRRRWPYLFVGWFWYLGMLTPVLGLVRISDHTMADRYMYLPGIGLYIAIAWGAARIGAASTERRWALCACAGLATAVLVAVATQQASFWRDDETLWRHALAVTADNSKAEFGLGDALAQGAVRRGDRLFSAGRATSDQFGPVQQSGSGVCAAGPAGRGDRPISPRAGDAARSARGPCQPGHGAGAAEPVRRGDGTLSPCVGNRLTQRRSPLRPGSRAAAEGKNRRRPWRIRTGAGDQSA